MPFSGPQPGGAHDIAAHHLWQPYTQMKTAVPALPVVATDGVRIHLEDGRTLIDGIASWWTAVHGYNHPHLTGAIRAQLDQFAHVMFGGLTHAPARDLAARLAARLPADLNHVFFAESGSVAVEVAMKMAVQFWLNRDERRLRFVHFHGGYHGDTAATMAVCDPEEGMHGHFKGYFPQHLLSHLPVTDDDEAKLASQIEANLESLAGMIVEPRVQGAGGMRFHNDKVLVRLRRLCDRFGLLLIFDEIFVGFGRTGDMFACEGAGVLPDIVTLSKALTGGMSPLSCAVARTKVFDAFWDDDPNKSLMHGPTYMAHALGCAAANASLDLFERHDRVGAARTMEGQMAQELAPLRGENDVVDVRVKAGVGVVQLRKINNLQGLRQAFVEEGVWIRPLGDVVYLTPPLTISADDLTQLTGAIRRVLTR
ncbi:MAG: adenosylmethionine--8-amino-7-oxononanoate transaminase [Pseudomonadota bacterium]